MNAAFDETNLDLSFIETMLNKCSIIDSLDHEEIQELIDVLIDKITWNGDSHEVTINFTGSNSEKIRGLKSSSFIAFLSESSQFG